MAYVDEVYTQTYIFSSSAPLCVCVPAETFLFLFHLSPTTWPALPSPLITILLLSYNIIYTHVQSILQVRVYLSFRGDTHVYLCVHKYILYYSHANAERVRWRRRDKTIVCAIDPKTRRNRVAECEVHNRHDISASAARARLTTIEETRLFVESLTYYAFIVTTASRTEIVIISLGYCGHNII